MSSPRFRTILTVCALALGACAPDPAPRTVSGNFDPKISKQVTAEANKDYCGGAPKEVTFEVKIKLNIAPADAKVTMAGHLNIIGENKDDFRFEGAMNRFVPHQTEVTIRLVFKPREVGPRFATLVLDLPAGTNPAGKIVVHLVGLGTCQNAEGAIGDKDGDGITDNHDAAPANPDRDGDGIPDGKEDKDYDGVVDKGETDPTKIDSDGDTKNDGDEDLNKDGNVDEADGETNPSDPNSC